MVEPGLVLGLLEAFLDVPACPGGPGQIHQPGAGGAVAGPATARAADATAAELAVAATDDPAHTPCGPQPWLTGFELPNPTAGKGIPYHPTAAGMSALADSVTVALSR